jgi:hypothetical protein
MGINKILVLIDTITDIDGRHVGNLIVIEYYTLTSYVKFFFN